MRSEPRVRALLRAAAAAVVLAATAGAVASSAHAAAMLDGGASDPAGDGGAADVRKVAVRVEGQVLRLAVTYEGEAPPVGTRTDVLISAEAVAPLDPSRERCAPTPGAAITITSDGQTATASVGPGTPPIPGTLERKGPFTFYVFDAPALVSSFELGPPNPRTTVLRDPFACIQVDSGGDTAFGAFARRYLKLTEQVAMDLVLTNLQRRYDRPFREIGRDTRLLCPRSLFLDQDLTGDGDTVLPATATCRFDYKTKKAYRFGRLLLAVRGGFLYQLQERYYTLPATMRDCGTRRRGGNGPWSYRTTGPNTINAFASGLPCAVARRFAHAGFSRRSAAGLPCRARRTGDSLMVICGRRPGRSFAYEVVS